jgi:hypothetical protein
VLGSLYNMRCVPLYTTVLLVNYVIIIFIYDLYGRSIYNFLFQKNFRLSLYCLEHKDDITQSNSGPNVQNRQQTLFQFTRRFRLRLWEEHLGEQSPALLDPHSRFSTFATCFFKRFMRSILLTLFLPRFQFQTILSFMSLLNFTLKISITFASGNFLKDALF